MHPNQTLREEECFQVGVSPDLTLIDKIVLVEVHPVPERDDGQSERVTVDGVTPAPASHGGLEEGQGNLAGNISWQPKKIR